MKYLMQLGIIAAVSCAGELLYALLPFPIPASVYGLVLMLVLLITKVIRLEMVEETADLIIAVMGIFFVPSFIGLMDSWVILKENAIGLLFVCIISAIIVMSVTGLVAQAMLKKKEDE
ncbi:MAG: CidA/LrgA family protein [Lachnospiraceae bacterium]